MDTLTQGRHSLLREAAVELARLRAGEVDLDPLRAEASGSLSYSSSTDTVVGQR